MRRWFTRALFVSVMVIVPVGALHILRKKSGNFRLHKIVPIKKKGSFFSGELPEVFPRFHYLAMGKHTYAFISEDKKWVLKFLRYHKFKPHFWKRLSFFSKDKREKDILQRNERLSFLLQSHVIASTYLKEETGLIYYQEPLAKDSLVVTLVSGLGREKKVDVNQYGFVLQKYFPLYGEKLSKLLEKKEPELIQKLFSSYFEVIAARFGKGFVNKDRKGWDRNYGVDQTGTVFEIDLGGFQQHTSEKDWEIKQCSRDFREWLQKNEKDLLPFFEKELQSALEKTVEGHQESRKQKLTSF